MSGDEAAQAHRAEGADHRRDLPDVPIRPAATVLLLRTAREGLEVFVQTRHINRAGVSVVMVEQNAKRCLQIWIGLAEAEAIALEQQGRLPDRPLTRVGPALSR